MLLNLEPTTLLGISAGFLTTMAYFPQVMKTWQSKSAEDMSWTMLVALCVGIVLWLVYGLEVHDTPVIVANIVTLMFTTTILGLKIAYSPRVTDSKGSVLKG
ncbi:MAG: SemiSWEET transporter [Cyanobacteria bacterium P01_H01_bin.130]